MTTLICPIGIDLGAKYTGVYHTQFCAGESWLDSDHKGFVIVDNKKKQWSQQERTAKRHQRRAIHRRKLAKRFFMLINKEFLKLDLKQKVGKQTLEEFILGLFNRRGYTYNSAIADYNIFLEKNEYAEKLENFLGRTFDNTRDIEECLFQRWQENNSSLEVPKDPSGKPKKTCFEKEINKIFDIYTQAKIEGHKARTDYLSNIKKDLEDASYGHLYNLIGNISNFQLRFLRKYFNDETFAKRDVWDEARFNKLLNRYLSAWHVKSPLEKQNLREIRNYQGKDFLFVVEPTKTIPPFEDQNNRNPQKCYSLILTANKLDKKLPGWETKYHRSFDSSFNLSMDKKFRRNELARNFQFYLDSRPEKTFKQRKHAILNHLAQGNEDLQLSKFLDDYEEERLASRYGYWGDEDSEDKVLSICNLQTGLKKKAQNSNLSAILKKETHAHELKKILASKLKGNRQIKGVLKDCAKLQKEYGNRLKYEWEKSPSFEKSLKSEIKTLGNGLPQDPFSLAQIYNILYDTSHGFASSCKYCARDNAQRMNEDEEGRSNAFRLSTTSSRPFDGVVARLLDSIAWEIIKKKEEEITPYAGNVNKILIPLVIEENAFEFQENLLDIKQATKNAKDKSIKKHKSFQDELYGKVGKWERIKNDSKGLCPYTGSHLSEYGQYDHIVARASTKKRYQTVLNSEPNLIYASIEGNRIKNNRNYSLQDLNHNYLQNIYGIKDLTVIENTIKTTWKKFKDEKFYFNSLSLEERRDIRHALFIEELREDVIAKLNTSNKTKVNGTQKYFASILIKKLKKRLGGVFSNTDIEITPFFVDAKQRADLRDLLSSKKPEYKKDGRNQDSKSHIIDAALCMAKILDKDEIAEYFQTSKVDGMQFEHLVRIIPQGEIERIEMQSKPKPYKENPESKKLFEDRPSAERYLSIFCRKVLGKILWKAGFSWENSFDLSKNDQSLIQMCESFGIFTYKNNVNITLKEHLDTLNENDQIYFSVNRFLLHSALAQGYLENSDSFELLSKLRKLLGYKTKKREIKSILLDDQGKNLRSFTSIREELEDKSQLIHGLRAPFIKKWLQVINIFENELKTWDEDKYIQMCTKIFPTINIHSKRHQKVRKVYSLPLKTGDGNIRRISSSFTQTSIFQLLNTSGTTHNGLVVTKNKNNFKVVDRPSPTYYQAKCLVPLKRSEERQGKGIPNNYFTIAIPAFSINGLKKYEVRLNASNRAHIKLYLDEVTIQKIKAIPEFPHYKNLKEKLKRENPELSRDEISKKVQRENFNFISKILSADSTSLSTFFHPERNFKVALTENYLTYEHSVPKIAEFIYNSINRSNLSAEQ